MKKTQPMEPRWSESTGAATDSCSFSSSSTSTSVSHNSKPVFTLGQEQSVEEGLKVEEWSTSWKSIYIVTLVAFIGAVHQNCIMVWPYIQLLDGEKASETFYGLLRSVSGLGSVSSALVAGWLSNLLWDTKWPMVFGKGMAMISCAIYMCIEVMPSVEGRKLAFLLFELCLGVSVGAANIYRVHIAMSSTEKDRPKAVGICSLAPALGLLFGPMIQLFFTVLKYPGIPFLFHTHINLFTAPILLTMAISVIGLVLLIFCFSGRMRRPPQDDPSCEILREQAETTIAITAAVIAEPTLDAVVKVVELDKKMRGNDKKIHDGAKRLGKEESRKSTTSVARFDWTPVVVCIFSRVVISLTLINLITVGPPYTMMVFRWTSTEAVRYQSIVLGLVAIHVIAWNLAYILLDIRRRVSERQIIIFSHSLLFCAMLCTYPWPFISSTIEYQQPIPPQALREIHSNKTTTTSGPAGAVEILGCPQRFSWCAWTPAVNMYLFLGSLIISLGVAMPLSQINLDILYSKVLGGIRQGTMQGIFVACGDGLNIVLPLALAKIYTLTGPVYIWRVIIACQAFCILTWILCYRRMISNTQRLQRIRSSMPHLSTKNLRNTWEVTK